MAATVSSTGAWRTATADQYRAGRNQGKGAALRIGLAKGRGRYLGFIDADGDLDPILLDSFQTMVRVYSPDIILGSKRHPLSEVEYPFLGGCTPGATSKSYGSASA